MRPDQLARLHELSEQLADTFLTEADPNEWAGGNKLPADLKASELPLDPHAAHDPAEFFAVASEAFFVAPAPLCEDYPQIYRLLAAWYRQDPLAAANSAR